MMKECIRRIKSDKKTPDEICGEGLTAYLLSRAPTVTDVLTGTCQDSMLEPAVDNTVHFADGYAQAIVTDDENVV